MIFWCMWYDYDNDMFTNTSCLYNFTNTLFRHHDYLSWGGNINFIIPEGLYGYGDRPCSTKTKERLHLQKQEMPWTHKMFQQHKRYPRTILHNSNRYTAERNGDIKRFKVERMIHHLDLSGDDAAGAVSYDIRDTWSKIKVPSLHLAMAPEAMQGKSRDLRNTLHTTISIPQSFKKWSSTKGSQCSTEKFTWGL